MSLRGCKAREQVGQTAKGREAKFHNEQVVELAFPRYLRAGGQGCVSGFQGRSGAAENAGLEDRWFGRFSLGLERWGDTHLLAS